LNVTGWGEGACSGKEAISERRWERVRGCERRLWIVVRSRMAVVSLPAVMLEVVHAVNALDDARQPWVCVQGSSVS